MAFPSLPAIIQNLPDALLSDAKDLGQRCYRLTLLVWCADFSIAFALGKSAIGDRKLRAF